MDASGLAQTIAIMAVCLIWSTKQAISAWKARNGSAPLSDMAELMKLVKVALQQLGDLWRWHKPVTDPKTGQPTFMWYENTAQLLEQMKLSREATIELRKAVLKLTDMLRDMKQAQEAER